MPPAGSFIANVAGCRGLTDRGAMQARALAGRLRTTVALAECRTLLSSPVLPARQTAAILAPALPSSAINDTAHLIYHH
jgi:phosphohistidine phosphatase SixA